jgi:hypothetical protein
MMLAPGEWLLAVLPAAGSLQHQAAAGDLAGRLAGLAGGPWRPAVSRVPGDAAPAGFGPAVLHFRAGKGSALYCAASQVSPDMASVLSVLLGQPRTPPAEPSTACHPWTLTVTRVPPEELPGPACPAAMTDDQSRRFVFVCASLISQGLAGTVALLCTAQARYEAAADVLSPAPGTVLPFPARARPAGRPSIGEASG